MALVLAASDALALAQLLVDVLALVVNVAFGAAGLVLAWLAYRR